MATRRPPDRKRRIADAAAVLFRERGFRNVSVSDVAEAVGITAPALYRHFRNKQALLAYVVAAGMDTMDAVGRREGERTDVDTLIDDAIAMMSERRGLATLWQRELRHLHDTEREELRHRLSSIASGYAGLIRAERPGLAPGDEDLLTWAMLGVWASMAAHRFTLPKRRQDALLHRLCRTVVDCPLGTSGSADAPAPTEVAADGAAATAAFTGSRREQMLTEAIRLFDERGFQSVSTDDIGEAVGTSGPNVYKHFPSKLDLLSAGVTRGGERREAGTAQALARATTPQQALDNLLHAYVEFGMENRHLLGLLVSELDQLPEQQRKRSTQVQRDFLALWVKILDAAAPGLEQTEAKIVVCAVFSVVDTICRNRRLLQRPDLGDRLVEIGQALLLAR
ncbi:MULTISPECIES: TetR/AcrR family transcriptional regulator [unclassified Streptomyces]|uniref:TetR/AcrR family transcriptional regulator n=1 Tax=unclassified Streptomyces TaxID=2593676 RepID=UPI00339FF44D